jgi:hypothetical protein
MNKEELEKLIDIAKRCNHGDITLECLNCPNTYICENIENVHGLYLPYLERLLMEVD